MIERLFKSRFHKFLMCAYSANISVCITLPVSQILYSIVSRKHRRSLFKIYMKRRRIVRIVVFHCKRYIYRHSAHFVNYRPYSIVIHYHIIIDRNAKKHIGNCLCRLNHTLRVIYRIYFHPGRARILRAIIISISRHRNNIYALIFKIVASYHNNVREPVVYTQKQNIHSFAVLKILIKRIIRVYNVIHLVHYAFRSRKKSHPANFSERHIYRNKHDSKNRQKYNKLL